MDARDLLRRYIEQRREAGETELVLDALHVDEVMRILGAVGRPAAARESAQGPALSSAMQSQDWRATLREAGGAETPPIERVGRLDFVPGPASTAATGQIAFKQGLIVGAAEPALDDSPIARLPSLGAIAKMVHECRRCPLYATATKGVPGEGNPKADLVCVGEAPGANEDSTGLPFVGQAGQLLTKILAAIDLKREEVFIVNVLKHRPPGNRNPRPEEVEACSPYLIRQLELIKPKVIVAFGTFAAQTLLQTKTPLGQLRGLVHRYHGTPLVVTYHPAALLRNPAWKRPTWEDVKLARRVLDSATGT